MVLVLVIWLAIVNLYTMRMFWDDKQRAIAGARRIPEAELLGFAVVGGSAGALLARHLFRHKTRKQPFSIQLQLNDRASSRFPFGTGAFLPRRS